MGVIDKAVVRVKHWMEHNDDHIAEYETFAKQLEEAGAEEAAEYIRDMADLTRQCGDCLNDALRALDDFTE